MSFFNYENFIFLARNFKRGELLRVIFFEISFELQEKNFQNDFCFKGVDYVGIFIFANKKFFSAAFGLSLVLFFISFFSISEGLSQNKRPNILVIMGDDISISSMGAYGNKFIKTPNFDRIAKEGVLFTNAYVCNNSASTFL